MEVKNSEILLNVENLKRYFYVKDGMFGKKETVRSVDGISFCLHRGETLAIVGESGCGKSTAMRSLLRITEPTDGKIFLNGLDFRLLRGKALQNERKKIKMIFQDPYSALNPRMTVQDIIAEPLDIAKMCKSKEERTARVLEAMDMVNLDRSYADRYPHEFSGGQRQRIGIARAIILRPQIIICDEPVSALDVSVQAKIINLLKDLQCRLGISYIFISHDLGVVKHIADRIAVMHDGKFVESGDAESVLENPQNEYTKLLLQSVPKIRREKKEVLYETR